MPENALSNHALTPPPSPFPPNAPVMPFHRSVAQLHAAPNQPPILSPMPENAPSNHALTSPPPNAPVMPFHRSVGTVLYQIIYSICVDLFADCHAYSGRAWVNFLIMLSGVILFAVGTGLYASASLGRGSYEAVTFALAEKNRWQVKTVRMVLDVIVVVIGVLLGGKFGICTIITVVISGSVIQFVNNKSKRIFHL